MAADVADWWDEAEIERLGLAPLVLSTTPIKLMSKNNVSILWSTKVRVGVYRWCHVDHRRGGEKKWGGAARTDEIIDQSCHRRDQNCFFNPNLQTVLLPSCSSFVLRHCGTFSKLIKAPNDILCVKIKPANGHVSTWRKDHKKENNEAFFSSWVIGIHKMHSNRSDIKKSMTMDKHGDV